MYRVKNKKHEFILNPTQQVNQDGEFLIQWKLPAHTEFSHGVYKRSYLFFTPIELPGQGMIVGVKIPQEVDIIISKLARCEIKEWERRAGEIVDRLIAGTLKVMFYVTGKKYPYYRPTLENIDTEEKKYSSANILEDAVSRIFQTQGLLRPSYQSIETYLEDQVNRIPRTSDQLPEYAIIGRDEELEEKYSELHQQGIALMWRAALSDILKDALDKEIERKSAQKEYFILYKDMVSKVNFRMLHSLGAIIEKGKISIFVTGYAKYMDAKIPNLKDLLNDRGFIFDKITKYWIHEDTPENRELLIQILKEHDAQLNPRSIGFLQCKKCGYWLPSPLVDKTGECGC